MFLSLERISLCCSDRLTDYVGEPYSTDYQEAWKQGRLWQLTVAQAQTNTNGSSQIPTALHIVPPLLSAAAWQAQASRSAQDLLLGEN